MEVPIDEMVRYRPNKNETRGAAEQERGVKR